MQDKIIELLRRGYELRMTPIETELVMITLRKGEYKAVGGVHLVSRMPVEDIIDDILDMLQHEIVFKSKTDKEKENEHQN